MDDELMKDQMEKDRLEWEKIERELFARREAERIANELEAQALLQLIEEERAKPKLVERVASMEETLDVLFGGVNNG